MESELKVNATPEMEHEAGQTMESVLSQHENRFLPDELRNRIYRYVFGGYRILIEVKSDHDDGMTKLCGWALSAITWSRSSVTRIKFASTKNRPEQPARIGSSHTFAFLKTCRQIHSEAHLLTFELNTFELKYPEDLDIWMLTLLTQLNSVQTLRLPTFDASGIKDDSVVSLFSCLPNFGGLQTVEIGTMILVWSSRSLTGEPSSEEMAADLQTHEDCEASLRWRGI
ncbi:hypothetical protein HBI38_116520 [Parastagonospora nodorum]|nr:hypothetical protein HBI73_089170 [Parastagonospora nodorum]KAH5356503.1 hypothetical protein HBI48_125500 [Parastagonospora nodorum]KAH5507547.1 hypothetical protein HBI29_122320 [Parastagonospora nodorum]KAH6267824.1 hypothetical protein HBI41_098500 [Parastagonospora nodorum]KAH6289400.1 hypothetical protein HBI40_097820 [Parastagonospora nodorum]